MIQEIPERCQVNQMEKLGKTPDTNTVLSRDERKFDSRCGVNPEYKPRLREFHSMPVCQISSKIAKWISERCVQHASLIISETGKSTIVMAYAAWVNN